MPTLDGNFHFRGHLTADAFTAPASSIGNDAISADAAIDRSKMAQETLKAFPVSLLTGRVWDAIGTLLPSAGAADDLGLLGGTYGTNTPKLSTGDVKNTTATRRARFLIPLPPEYHAGETVQLRVKAGMETTVASVSATVDIEAFKTNEEGAVDGADLVTDAAQSINALADAYKDFSLTPTSLVAGDVLDVRLTIATNDSATATAVIAIIGALKLLCDCRG